ncbi:MAG: fibronectin type III domain-containing protein [bacterium]
MKLRLLSFLVVILGITTIAAVSCGFGGGSDTNKPPVKDPTTPIPFPDDGEIPDQPRNVFALAGDTIVTLTWKTVTSAIGYRIYQSLDGVTFIRLTSSVNFTENTAIIFDLINGKTYYFGVASVDERNNESGIAYVGGSPTATKLIPHGPTPPVEPEPPTDLDWIPGDRIALITWEHPDASSLDGFLLERKMHINPLASVPGNTLKDRQTLIKAYEDLFHETFSIGTEFDTLESHPHISGFTSISSPYFIDEGITLLGLLPNYLPLGLVNGDVDYEYKLGAVMEPYTAYTDPLTDVVPDDYPPAAPELLAVYLVAKKTGDGVGVYMEWSQPPAPYNSDIRNYILTRVDETQLAISILINTPFNSQRTSIAYQDDTVQPGGVYSYQIRAQDYYSQISPTSNIQTIQIPGGEPPPEE